MAGDPCWCSQKRKRLVVPGRYREVRAGMCGRVSQSRSAFEVLERYAMKVARTVLRGGSGSNVTPLPDHPTHSLRSPVPAALAQAVQAGGIRPAKKS